MIEFLETYLGFNMMGSSLYVYNIVLNLRQVSITLLFASILYLLAGCDNSDSRWRVMSIDDSLAVVEETTNLFSDSCIPECWPRNFSDNNKYNKYKAYLWNGTFTEGIKMRSSEKLFRKNFSDIDTSYYEIIDHFSEVDIQEIDINNIKYLSNKFVEVVLVDKLQNKMEDYDLGYLKISPVVINIIGTKGVFFYEISGNNRSSWLVCIEKKQKRWVIISKSRISIS